MKPKILILCMVVLALLAFGVAYATGGLSSVMPPVPNPDPLATTTPPVTPPPTPHSDLIQISAPSANAVVGSPLTVSGKARGSWYFEANFPVTLLDANGKTLAQVGVQAQGEWMTNEFVPFEATFTFATPTTDTGTLVFANDNPSGLPENSKEVRIPVRFDRSQGPQQTVQLYYYDPARDTDTQGTVLCSAKGLVAVDRVVPVTQTPIQDTVRLLISGNLTAAERSRGITTEYPLPGFSLTAASLSSGTLTLTFDDPQNRTTGGACRTAVLWAQIESTAKQFSGVSSVRSAPAELFQP